MLSQIKGLKQQRCIYILLCIYHSSVGWEGSILLTTVTQELSYPD